MHIPPSRHTQGELAACFEGRCQRWAACLGTSHHHIRLLCLLFCLGALDSFSAADAVAR